MSLFNYLQLQEVEPDDAASELDYFEPDEITLDDAIDGESLDRSWGAILQSEDTES